MKDRMALRWNGAMLNRLSEAGADVSLMIDEVFATN